MRIVEFITPYIVNETRGLSISKALLNTYYQMLYKDRFDFTENLSTPFDSRQSSKSLIHELDHLLRACLFYPLYLLGRLAQSALRISIGMLTLPFMLSTDYFKQSRNFLIINIFEVILYTLALALSPLDFLTRLLIRLPSRTLASCMQQPATFEHTEAEPLTPYTEAREPHPEAENHDVADTQLTNEVHDEPLSAYDQAHSMANT